MVVTQLALGDDSAATVANVSVLETEAAMLAASEVLTVDVVVLMVELIFDVDFEEGATLVIVLHLVLDAVLFLVDRVLPAMLQDFEVTAVDAVEVLLEVAMLLPVEKLFEEAALATELLFADKAAAAVKELFFKENVLVVVIELFLEMAVYVAAEEVFKADDANDELTLVSASVDVAQLALSFCVTPASTVESFFKHEATVDTAPAFLTGGGDITTVEQPVLVDAGDTTALVLSADRLAVTTVEALNKEEATLDTSTVCTGLTTEVCGFSVDDAAGGSQSVDGDVNT